VIPRTKNPEAKASGMKFVWEKNSLTSGSGFAQTGGSQAAGHAVG
jgi:hypothetical protein